MNQPERILIIKLSALGNVILSLGPFAAIRVCCTAIFSCVRMRQAV